jgi:hypothetical protein
MATPKLRRFSTQITLDVSYTALADIEKHARELRESLEAQGWTDLTVEMTSAPYEDREYPYVFGKRMETMEEAEKRETEEARAQAARDDFDRRQYEALRKKFGDKV